MNTNRHLAIASMAVLLTVLVLGIAMTEEETRLKQASLLELGQNIERGGLIYDTHCASCHGRWGEGVSGVSQPFNASRDWNSRPDVAKYRNQYDFVYSVTAAGRPEDDMPFWSNRYGGPLGKVQLEAVSQYILNWAGEPGELVPDPPHIVGPGAPLRGEMLFVAHCSVCHGEGTGGGQYGPSLRRDELAAEEDELFRRAITYGRPGTPMVPWAWDVDLSPQEVEDLITFIRSRQSFPAGNN